MQLRKLFAKASSHPFDYVGVLKNRETQYGWWHSFELPDGTLITGANDLAGLKARIDQFPIPRDLRGKRVLDIGAWDGWFSFEMERRGAEVLAIDNWDNPRFHEMHSLLNSRVEYQQIDMYDLTPERIGRFDIVLFMGVLYHLKHPLLALERVCALTTDMAAVDSFVLQERHRAGVDAESRPIMEFYETGEFGGQTDNWCGPSVDCLLALCRTAGFARVELKSVREFSACVACHRKWEPPSSNQAGPAVLNAAHNTNYGINFDSRRDDNLTIWFRTGAAGLTVGDVKPEVGGYGVRPIHVKRIEDDLWQANFKLPPGLTPGWHDVRVSIGGGSPGSAAQVAVDVPLESVGLEITGVSDGTTWTANRVDLSRGTSLSLWLRGLPANADRHNLRAFLGEKRAEITYIEPAQEGPRQVNLHVPAKTAGGPGVTLEIRLGDHPGVSTEIEVVV